MFAVDSKGSLLWKSDKFNNSLSGYSSMNLFKLSPALLSKKNVLIAVSADNGYLVTLSSVDGSILKKYDIPQLAPTDNGSQEPPIIAGSNVYLIKSHDSAKYYLFAISLNEVTGLSL